MITATGNEYAYFCDGLACKDGCPKESPCMHTTNPEHSVTLQHGGNPVFVRLASRKFFEVEDISKLADLYH